MNVVWSALIAGGMALLGVIFANWHHSRALGKQFRNESTEREKERLFALRRETYLKAVEELTAAQTYLGSLPERDPSDMNAGEALKGFFASTAKLQLVAETNTALLANEIVGDYGELLMRLVTALIPFQKISIDHGIADGQYQKESREVQRIIESMQNLNESGKPDPDRFSSLERSVDFHNKQTERYAFERNSLAQRKVEAQFDFVRLLASELKGLSAKQTSLLVAIREDLGLHSEIEKFENQFKQQADRLAEGLEVVLKETSNQFDLSSDVGTKSNGE